MNPLEWIAVAIITIMSSARLTRLATVDKFPPIVWLRDKYADALDGTGYDLLVYCGYCFSFWATAAVVLWGWLTGWSEPWWLVNSIFGASYAAAIVMANDGDEGEQPYDEIEDDDIERGDK